MDSILITGASSGIGRELAIRYAAPGVRLWLLGRNAERLEEVASRCREAGASVECASIDVQDHKRLADWIDEADKAAPVELAIVGAGITSGTDRNSPFENPAAVRAMLAINLMGAVNTIHPLIEPMCRRRRGRIVVMGSIAGLRGLPYSPAYCAAKAGLQVYCEGLRAALAPFDVKISTVVFGFVATPMNETMVTPRPLQITAGRAAEIIQKGIARGRAHIVYPKSLNLLTELSRWLPHRWVDAILLRARVEIGDTKERVLGEEKSDAAV